MHLKESEKAGVLFMKPVVIPVEDAGDASHGPAVLLGEESSTSALA